MPIVCKETPLSPEINDERLKPGATRHYFAYGSIDEVAILNAVIATSPAKYLNLIRQSVKTKPLGGNFWTADVAYQVPDYAQQKQGQGGQCQIGGGITFDTAGGTRHITQSQKTISQTARAGFAFPQTFKAIGLKQDNGQNTIEGTDIVAPAYQFSITQDLQGFGEDDILTLARATGKVNDSAWLNFDEGELLFLGASGNYRYSDQGWTVTFKWAFSETIIDSVDGMGNHDPRLDICGDGTLVVPRKNGWDYLWVGYKEQKVGNLSLPQPYFANVERVYLYIDFAETFDFNFWC